MSDIDWKGVIERQSRDLFFVMTEMFFMAGLNKGVPLTVLTRRVYRRMLILLRPAEAALRRLIIIAARGIVLKVRPSGPFPKGLAAKLKRMERASDAASDTAGAHSGVQSDRAAQAFRPARRTQALPGQAHLVSAHQRAGLVHAVFSARTRSAHLRGSDQRRAAHPAHHSVRHALATLPKQARRYVRWRGKMLLEIRKLTARKRGSRISTIRPGYPLGHRKKQIHEVDRVLSDCCYFLDEARKKPDTS